MSCVEHLQAAIEELESRLDEEIRVRKELERRCYVLEKMVCENPATHVLTETYLQTRIREEITRATRYPCAITLLTMVAATSDDESLSKLASHLSDEMRDSDHIFSLNDEGLAILMVETPKEGTNPVIKRLRNDIEQLVRIYGYSVTSFPVDANLADDFLNLAMERHCRIRQDMEKPETSAKWEPHVYS